MKHYDYEISLFVEDELPDEQVHELNMHLASCKSCRQVLSDYIEIKNDISRFYKGLPENFQGKNQKSLSTNSDSSIINEIHRKQLNSYNIKINSYGWKKLLIPFSIAASFIIVVLAFWTLVTHNIQHTYKSGNISAIPKDMKQTVSTQESNPSNLYTDEDGKMKNSSKALNSQVKSLKRQQTNSFEDNYVLTFKCFNEEIDKSIAAHKDSIMNIGYLLSFTSHCDINDFNSVIDSVLIKQNLQILN
ncbi:MAG: anti-sigma factor family protein [Clostridiales bacterium]